MGDMQPTSQERHMVIQAAMEARLGQVIFEVRQFGRVSLEGQQLLDDGIRALNAAYSAVQADRLAGS